LNSENILIKVEDIKAYIESGILELYVLGDLNHDERTEVESMLVKYPDLKVELNSIEEAIASFAEKTAIEPPTYMRDRILGSFDDDIPNDFKNSAINEINDNKVVNLKQYNFYKFAFAACFALLLLSVYFLFSLNSKLQQTNAQIASLQSEKQQFAKTVSFKNGELEVFQDVSFKFLNLQGTAKVPNAKLTIAWSPIKRKVWIDLKSVQMPINDKNHQYQLWALVKGKPVDLGVFNKTADTTSDMKEMKSVELADAFAVTLEPQGGSVTPTMDQMVVIGKF
jgi:anti-sigma-K factor RskA